MSMQVFHKVSRACSRITTGAYSTSFSSAIRLLHNDLREPVYDIYGLVRFADEVVDTFHSFDKQTLLSQFKADTYNAIKCGISLNPILNSFQLTVNRYRIDLSLVEAFFRSMEMDLSTQQFNSDSYTEYIYGSAEVVGLMCLQVFCDGNIDLYKSLQPAAQALGAAFQKVNFLRDVNADYNALGRTYFPGADFSNFSQQMKNEIEEDIDGDFRKAYNGILQLPWKARFGVYVAYKYYLSLFRKIKRVEASRILRQRIRIPNYKKAMIIARAGLKNQLNMI